MTQKTFARNVAPDSVDFRDRVYRPSVALIPAAGFRPRRLGALPVLNQRSTDACTGFAMAACVHALLLRRDGALKKAVSPFMLYGMARRYDNLPGDAATSGSTCRGVLKGWFKHGVCEQRLWPRLEEPTGRRGPTDWWDDGVRRPLGAYYRVEPRSVVDMQVALLEAGVLLASAQTHAGWEAGHRSKPTARLGARGTPWQIPYTRGARPAGGHAFAIVGYTARGFIIQNSWGEAWGTHGLAELSYDDWLDHGYDCWVAQLGVVTELHLQAAAGHGAPRAAPGSHTGVLDVHALSPYIVNTGNDGALSASGIFHTRESDLDEIVNTLMPAQRRAWQIPAGEPMDVVLYAHGGLTDEQAAAATAGTWIPLLMAQRMFPVFFMWESGLVDTILNEIAEAFRKRGEVPTGGPLEKIDRWWSDRIEGVARVIGKPRWGEMKENARLLSENARGGARLMANRLRPLTKQIRLHLVGHSAGAIIHSHLAALLANDGWTLETLNLLAPAVRVDTFDALVLPLLRSGRIRRMAQFHLNDATEADEGGMRAALGYRRSLLYLISNGLEERREVPVLGMQKYFDAHAALPNVTVRVAPESAATHATRHGGFDDDAATQRSVVAHIGAQAVPQ
ncbi:MAG: C1 family peptidase [Burkholderiaceae bacterium]